jgi:phosphogluconate dehydratase
LLSAFKAGELERDVICVVRWQGPQANGMPELHKLTPPLAVLQGRGLSRRAGHRRSHERGFGQGARRHSRVAGSGGRAALAKLRDGDMVRLDATAGTLQALVPDADWAQRENAVMPAT